MLQRICDLISRWMAVIVLATAVCSLLFPEGMSVIRTQWISPLLGVVMFGMGLTLQFQDFRIVFTRPRDVLIGCGAQFCIMPLLAWGLVRAFHLPAELAVGVMLVGCCPGGTASNVITYLAGGDLALSVGITGVATLLAPVVTPLLVWLLAGTHVDVAVWPMFLSIVQVVVLPILLGLAIKYLLPRLTQRISGYLPAFSTLAIATIVAAIVAANAHSLLTSGLLIIAVVVLHNLLGFCLGYALGRLCRMTPRKLTAITIEVGMQNSGLACSLAQQHFAQMAMAGVPGALFSVWHNIAGALMARLLRTWQVRDEK